MPRRQKPPELKPATLRPEEMRSAIPRLRARIVELGQLDLDSVRERTDPRIDALEQKINSTLADVFGPDTFEYNQFGHVTLDKASFNLFAPTPMDEVREGLAQGVALATASLEGLIALFEEKLGGGSDSPARRAAAGLGHLNLHPEIARVVTPLFANGHYSNAVEDGCKALDGFVKMRSGRYELSGSELMQKVFSPKDPVLAFTSLSTETDRSVQQGMMFLYAGAMLALRNPRAHGILEDDPENALEYIGLINMLAKALDRAKNVVRDG